MSDRRIEYIRVDEVLPALRNPKKHSPDITASISRFGFTEPVVMDERTGRLVAGHGRLESLSAAQAEGGEPPDGIVVTEDGAWALPVVRGWASRSDSDAEGFLIASNRVGEAGGWDDEALADLLRDYSDDPEWLTGTGYSHVEFDALLADHAAPPEPLTDPDDVPEPPTKPITQSGDLWLLGRHRVLCGDCRLPDHVARLLAGQQVAMVYADPPYGINLATDYTALGHGHSRHHHREVVGDDTPFEPAPLIDAFGATEQFWWGADHYYARLPDTGSWIVWDKRWNDTDMDLDELFGSSFEVCWSRARHRREMVRILWAMTHGEGAEGEDARRGLHPTQKPVALAAWCIDRASKPGDVVLDPFAGAGAAVIAAHQTGRLACLMEIDAAYVDVIAARWQAYTGEKPVLESTGEPHDFLTEASLT